MTDFLQNHELVGLGKLFFSTPDIHFIYQVDKKIENKIIIIKKIIKKTKQNKNKTKTKTKKLQNVSLLLNHPDLWGRKEKKNDHLQSPPQKTQLFTFFY